MTLYSELVGKSPEELRKLAQDSSRRSQESFERSDTDGFLSQWASDQTARVYQYAARLAENGWFEESIALFDLDGNLVSTELVQGTFGAQWIIRRQQGGPIWVTPSRARKAVTRRANLEKKGYRHGTIRRRVIPATSSGGGYNIAVYGEPDRNYPDIEIVSTDNPGEDW